MDGFMPSNPQMKYSSYLFKILNPTMDNYSCAKITGSNLPQYLANSLLAAALTALMTFVATGGYALGRLKFLVKVIGYLLFFLKCFKGLLS